MKHGTQLRASAFATQCLAARALLAWAGGVAEQRARRAAEAGAVRGAAVVLGARKAGRALAAWREVHARWVYKSLQVREMLYWNEGGDSGKSLHAGTANDQVPTLSSGGCLNQ